LLIPEEPLFMTTSIRHVVGVLGLLVLAVACGGGSRRATPASGLGTTNQVTEDNVARDRGAAQRAVLQLSDFPSGWTGTPSTDDPTAAENKAGQKRFAACLKVEPSLIGAGAASEATAASDDFGDSDNHQVSSTVTVTPTAKGVRGVLDAVRKPEAPGCFQAFVNDALVSATRHPKPGEELPPGVTFAKAEVDRLTMPGLDGDYVAYRARVPVVVEGQSVDATFDMALTLTGRTGTTMTFISFGAPFPAELETQLTNKVLGRAPAA
jgi:hypothetical protein